MVALQGEGRLALRHGVRVTSESDLGVRVDMAKRCVANDV